MAIGSDEQYAAGPFQANDLIVNNQAMFSNPGMMALVAKEARKGTGGFFEIPNRDRKEAPFLTAAKERVNQELGLSPAVQEGINALDVANKKVNNGMSRMAEMLEGEAPPGEMLAYINPEEASMLQMLGGSGEIQPTTGIPSFRPGRAYMPTEKSYANTTSPSSDIPDRNRGQSNSNSNTNTNVRASNQSYEDYYDSFDPSTAGDAGTSGSSGDYESKYGRSFDDQTTRDDRRNAEQSYFGGDPDPIPTTSFKTDAEDTGTTMQSIVDKLDEEDQEKFEKYNNLSATDLQNLKPEQQAEYNDLKSQYERFALSDLKNTIETDDSTGGGDGVVTTTKKAIKKIMDDMGVDMETAKTLAKRTIGMPFSIAGSVMKSILDKLKYPTEKSFKDNNYLAIMQNKYLNADGSVKKGMENDFKRFSKDYSDLMPTTGGSNTQQKNFSMKDMLRSGKIGDNTDLERRLNPSKYYEDNPMPSTVEGLAELGRLNAQDFADDKEMQSKIFAARLEGSKGDDNRFRNNIYQGYTGPVVEKDPDEVSTMPVETPAIDPAVGTRPFATPAAGGSQYQLPTNYRAALTRDGEYGINTDPKSIAYSGGFNQMEDMDEYLQRIGKKRKNYLDEDGNPIMTNAMGGQ